MRWAFGVRPVFIDTSAWFALEDANDQWHEAAMRARAAIVAGRRWHSVTTNFVVAETHARILKRGHRAAAHFLEQVDGSRSVTTVRIEEEDEQAARDIIYRYSDKDFSLVDALSFAVMDRLGIQHAFTFDQHFQQYGKTILTPGSVR